MNRLLILLSATMMIAGFSSAQGQTSSATPGKDLVAKLYKEHSGKSDPLLYPASKKLLQNYFSKPLLDLYLKDQEASKGEVGKLDFDPLYDAQDLQVTGFNLATVNNKNGSESVTARFKNTGVGEQVVFTVESTKAGWRISDIRYKDGRSLLKTLK